MDFSLLHLHIAQKRILYSTLYFFNVIHFLHKKYFYEKI